MNAGEISEVQLRYRFDDLKQAKVHVLGVEGRCLFFYRDDRLALPPEAPVRMEWTFRDGEPTRLLHGTALEPVERCGIWMELSDTRPLRELAAIRCVRRHRRLATDLPVEVAHEGAVEPARLLDVSAGGARVEGILGLARGAEIRLRLPSFDDPNHLLDLGLAFVAWAERGELGLQFDRLSTVSRMAVLNFVQSIATDWSQAHESRHPSFCCGEAGPLEVPLPDSILARIAG